MRKKAKRGFPKDVVAAVREGKILGIRAEKKPHRIIGIWAVVVENRLFGRSWSLKERSWYRAFLEVPVGVIEVEGSKIPVRAVRHARVATLCAGLRAQQEATRYDYRVGAGKVSSGQWAVGSGQWAVGSGQWAVRTVRS